MAQKVYDLGPVCPIYKGNWSATATYETLNMARHGTALWVMIAKTYTVGSTPSDSSSFWKKAAQDGATGAKGDKGATGATGPKGDKGEPGATPTLSSAVNSTSTTVAANSAAVKTAYDLTTTARNDANSKVTAAQAANAAMPGRYIDVSYDSNRTYQAPADGYFLITSTESGNTGLYVYDSANATLLYQSFIMGSAGSDNSVMLPVKKSNHIRSVGTYVASKIKHYRFIYAEGNA